MRTPTDGDGAGRSAMRRMGRRNDAVAPGQEREGLRMRNVAICAGIAIALIGAIVMMGFQENIVLLWAAVTTMIATSIR